jgi:hypothetical protein
MKVKLTAKEWEELQTYRNLQGPGFEALMARLHYRADQDSGELWLDNDDFVELATHAAQGKLKDIRAIFGRSFHGENTFLDKYK